MPLRIVYGTLQQQVDVTAICVYRASRSGIIKIPATDEQRARVFSDCATGQYKDVFLYNDKTFLRACPRGQEFYIDIKTGEHWLSSEVPAKVKEVYPARDVQAFIKEYHSTTHMEGGSFADEIHEQVMAATYLTGKEKVLELGSNIGRNTLLIARLLGDKGHFATMECDPISHAVLMKNVETNKAHVTCFNAALSERPLALQGWTSIPLAPGEKVPEGYKSVPTMTWKQVLSTLGWRPDTLVLDCEGAFYHILNDTPDVLQGVTKILMENDYTDINHKRYVDAVLVANGFRKDYSVPLLGHQNFAPEIMENFWEAWVKI